MASRSITDSLPQERHSTLTVSSPTSTIPSDLPPQCAQTNSTPLASPYWKGKTPRLAGGGAGRVSRLQRPSCKTPGRRPAVGIGDRSQRGTSILRRFRNDSVSRGRRIVAGEACPALKRKAPPIADGGATARSVVRLERIHVGSKYDRLRQQRALSDPGTSRLTLS